MTNQNENAYTRRMFLQQGLTMASLTATVPLFVQQSAFGMMRPLGSLVTSQAGVPEDRVLVVVQLGGGNDGLNTVIPYGDRAYYNARPTIGIRAPGGDNDNGALQLDQSAGIGLNPALEGLKELFDDGVASIVQGVGYPNPNRSHFASMDIWHTADTSGASNGWIGRYFDNTCAGSPKPESGIAIGRDAPLAMIGQTQKPVTFESAELFRWVGEDLHSAMKDPYDQINRSGTVSYEGADPNAHPNAKSKRKHQQNEQPGDDQLSYLMRTALDAQLSSERIRAAVARRPAVAYPGGPLSQQLQVVASMIRDEMPTRVYYVSLGGFDTHANQTNSHANLLRQLGGSLRSFYNDIKEQGNSGRVLTMVFSEFGRRVKQNGSGGTDHGTAAPMYFVGDMLRPGLLGRHPSLTDLDQGDLKHTVDFRSIYASVLKNWMGADPRQILGGDYRPANLFT